MKFIRFFFFLLIAAPMLFAQNNYKVGFLADKELNLLTPEEQSAFEWLKKAYPASEVVTFDTIEKEGINNKYDLVWWHYDEAVKLPAKAETGKVKDAINGYLKSGKGILLTLLAAQYTVDLKIETVPPNKVLKEGWVIKDTYKEIKGFHSFEGHPIFRDLFDGAYTWNTKQNYPFAAAYYDGILPKEGMVIGIGWDYITFMKNERHVIEYDLNKAKCISIGSYLYFNDSKNVYRRHLEKLMANTFAYIAGFKNGLKKSFWNFDELAFEVTGGSGPIKSLSLKKSDLNFASNSGLEIARETANSANYCESAGLRTLMMGKETGGLDEVWVHPLRAFMNYSVTVIEDGKETELNNSNPSIIARPESFTRNYTLAGNKITETLIASRNLPSGIINYKINSTKPVKVVIKFNADNRIMWPYDHDFPGKYNAMADPKTNSVFIKSFDKSISSIFGTDVKSIPSVKEETTKEKTKTAGIEFTIDLPAGKNEFNFVFAASNENINATTGYYKKTISNIPAVYNENVKYYKNLLTQKTIIETPDKEFNEAYKWALVGVDKFFVRTYPLGSSLMAGFGTTERGWDGGQTVSGRPGYAWYFGRDSEWTSFALLDYGDFDKVKSVLEFLGKYQDLTGKIFHELTSSNAVHYDAADATPLYVILMGKYYNATGDISFLKKEWPKIKKAIDFCYGTDTDKDGLIENTNVGHGWVEGGKIYGAHVTFYLAGLWSSTLEYGSIMAEAMNNKTLAAGYLNDSKKVKDIIERDFWNKETNFYNDGKNIDGSFSPTKTIQVTVPMYFNATSLKRSEESVKEFLGNDYTTDWGVRIIGESNPMFNPRGYHYGTVWPLFTGWASLAEYKYGFSNQAFSTVYSNLMIYKNWGLGYIEEVLNGIEYKPAGVCSHQAWSESMALQPLLEGMIGIMPDKQHNVLNLAPQIPADYKNLDVKNIKFGNKEIDMHYSVANGVLDYSFTSPQKGKSNIVLTVNLAQGASVKNVLVNATSTKYKLENGKVVIDFTLAERCDVKVETEGGILLAPVLSNPQVNGKPYGTRVISEKLDGNKYCVKLEGIPEKAEKLTLFTNKNIKKITGGILISSSGEAKIIEVKFPKSDKNYVIADIEIEL